MAATTARPAATRAPSIVAMARPSRRYCWRRGKFTILFSIGPTRAGGGVPRLRRAWRVRGAAPGRQRRGRLRSGADRPPWLRCRRAPSASTGTSPACALTCSTSAVRSALPPHPAPRRNPGRGRQRLPEARSRPLVRRPLKLRQAAGDLAHPLVHLDRRVLADAYRQELQRPGAQFRRLDRGRQVEPERISVIAGGHAGMISASPDGLWNPLSGGGSPASTPVAPGIRLENGRPNGRDSSRVGARQKSWTLKDAHADASQPLTLRWRKKS